MALWKNRTLLLLCTIALHVTASKEDDYNCSICHEIVALPSTLRCGHTFCYECIHTHYKYNNRNCPMCRQQFYWFPMTSKLILKSQIDQYITDEKPEEKEEYEIRVQRGENLINGYWHQQQSTGRMNTSKYTGVCWSRQNKKWKVTIHGRYGGLFDIELDAAKRVNQLCEEYGIARKNPGIDAIPNQQQQNMNWFDNFSDERRRRINDFMLDTITQHGSLTQQASDDVQAVFGLSSNQTQQVYDHLQENMNWFHCLDERRALGATTMMKEAIQRFGGFNEQVIAEMQTHFRFTSVQSRQLYEHLNTQPQENMNWFHCLDERRALGATTMMKEAIQRFGGFNEQVIAEMQTHFHFTSVQSRQLYEHLNTQPELPEIEFINITFDSVDDIGTIKTNNDQNYETESGEEEEEEEDGIQKIVDTNNKRKRNYNSKK